MNQNGDLEYGWDLQITLMNTLSELEEEQLNVGQLGEMMRLINSMPK